MQSKLSVMPYSPAFGVKISDNFIKVAHNHYNYGIGTNKLKNIYNFNEKVKNFENFEHDNYVLDYEKKLNDTGNWTHYLVATKISGKGKDKIVVAKKHTLLKFINNFINMSERDFNNIFYSKNK